MHCIGNEMLRVRPTARVVYKTSDNFVDEFIRSIRLDRIHHFREKYRRVDLLMIDDVVRSTLGVASLSVHIGDLVKRTDDIP